MYGRGDIIRVIESAHTVALDAEEAARVWQALVAGRWSVVDTLESNGRRFILAQANASPHRGLKALTKRERQIVEHAARGLSNKAIAYALGLAPSTVATHLSAAKKKLGGATRMQLVEMFAMLGGFS
jgi:DNA-binding NarL/FixJ family response regulator